MWSIGPESSGAGSPMDARTESSSVADIAYERLRTDILGGALPPRISVRRRS